MVIFIFNVINKLFGIVYVLYDINLVIVDKEFVVFVGLFGCGKFMLLWIIVGLEEIILGQIVIDGMDVSFVDLVDCGIFMVFQFYVFYLYLSVYENIVFLLCVQKMEKVLLD